MGLAFSHCNANWAYSGFKSFRCSLWTLAGFDGNLYSLYHRGGIEFAKDHPLYPLFNHSDCEGVLTPEELERILPELDRLAPLLPDWYDRETAGELIKGMHLALSRCENLQFH